jgi:hypothetical protein
MKTLRSDKRISYLRAALGVALIFSLAGCATTAPVTTPTGTGTPLTTVQVDVLNGLKTIRSGVEAAVKVFNAGYQVGDFTDKQRTDLSILYAKYQQADAIAANLLVTTTDTTPAEIVGHVTMIAGDVIKFVQSLNPGANP